MNDRKAATPKSQEKINRSRALLARIDDRMRLLGIQTDTEVCRKAGIEKGYLNNLRRPTRDTEPGVFSTASLAVALECSVGYLAGETSEPSVPLDNDRFRRAVALIVRMVQAKTLMLEPNEIAELTLHIYNDPSSRDGDIATMQDAAIGWLSGSMKRRD